MKTLAAARACNVATLFVTGGVAANNELRQRFEQDAAMEGLPVYFPSRPLSTDNAAMIAAAAYPNFLPARFAAMDFSAEAGMALQLSSWQSGTYQLATKIHGGSPMCEFSG